MRCPVVVKVVVAAGKVGRLLAHLFGQGSGMRWWGLPGDHHDVQAQMAVGVYGHGYQVVWEWQVLWGQEFVVEMGAG